MNQLEKTETPARGQDKVTASERLLDHSSAGNNESMQMCKDLKDSRTQASSQMEQQGVLPACSIGGTEAQNSAAGISKKEIALHPPATNVESDKNSQLKNNGKPIEDLDGNTCKIQPQNGEVPTLLSGSTNRGCDYSKLDENMSTNFQRGSESVVRVNVAHGKQIMSEGHHGSGLILAKGRPGECLILTDNHVVHGESGTEHLNASNTKMANGKTYPSEIRTEDASHDLAVMAVKTGSDTEAVCKPAEIAPAGTSVEPEETLLGIGFPERSQSAYASPGTVYGIEPLDGSNTKGEKIGRPIIDAEENVRRGLSGGPVYNDKGQVVGVMDKDPFIKNTDQPDPYRAVHTPVDQTFVNSLVRKALR